VAHASSEEIFGWNKYEGNPVLSSGGGSYKITTTPSVLYENGSDNFTKAIFYATSSDGVNWTKQGLSVIEPRSEFEIHLVEPTVVRDTQGYKMWYVGIDSIGKRRLFLAISNDGVIWAKHSNSPLPMGYEVHMPFVMHDEGIYKMWSNYQNPSDPTYRVEFVFSTSSDGVNWTPVISVFMPPNPGEFDYKTMFRPCVIKNNGIYEMWYGGNNFLMETYDHKAIGHAISQDGIYWIRDERNPILVPGNSYNFDSRYVAYPSVIKIGKDLKMFYAGGMSDSEDDGKIGLATLDEVNQLPKPGFYGVINIPKTGQSTCYNNSGGEIDCLGTGQDGEIRAGVEWPSQRFMNQGNGMILDSLSGLIWATDGNTPQIGSCIGGAKTWQQALEYVACLNQNNYLGFTDWRLPNINESKSLNNYGEQDVAAWLNSQGFSLSTQNYYWSSTTRLIHEDEAWILWINEYGMGTAYIAKETFCNVLLTRAGQKGNFDSSFPANVKSTGQKKIYATGDDGDLRFGVAWPSPRFTNIDGTPISSWNFSIMVDQLSGLMWVQPGAFPTNECTYWAGQVTLDYAYQFVRCLNQIMYLGNGDWRFPNMKELDSLSDFSKVNPTILGDYFMPLAMDYGIWSSTSTSSMPYYEWGSGLANRGGDGMFGKDYYSRCIILAIRTANRCPLIDVQTNIEISNLKSSTIVAKVFDPENDSLNCRWLKGDTELIAWHQIDSTAECNLDLSQIPELPTGRHILTIETKDNQCVKKSKVALIVTNSVPLVEIGPDAVINEGETFIRTGSIIDPDNDTWIATVDYGDGSNTEPLTINSDKTFTLNHLYIDNKVCKGDGNDKCTITVAVNDNKGGVSTDTLAITVNNLPPTIESIFAPITPVSIGTLIEAEAIFSDPGILDTHSAYWDWGDGNPVSPGLVNENNGAGTVTGAHTYLIPGVYTITLRVEDDDGDSDEALFQYLVVYDPNGGFVTGGGWINSPPEAYRPAPSLVGKATFGFVSKYQKGATVPTGQTEFQFRVADLNFKSTSYEWLVIAGARAKYKGSGTINGSGDYGFMLTAIDGQIGGGGGVDMFRIKIWEEANDSIIYDNKHGAPDTGDDATELGGGSIVIHKN
jgi:predicted GH43/DUF377 family glycosyl hydrolase